MRNGKRLSILIITLGLVLAGCGRNEQSDVSIPELLEPISVAENTIQVKRQDFYFADYIDVTVVPQMEELCFVMDGEILEIEVKEGQMVEKGDVLAKVDQTGLNDTIKELQETIAYEEKLYNMQLTQADLDVQIAEAKLAKLQEEYDEQEQKKVEEEAKKKAEAEAAAQASAKKISVIQSFDALMTGNTLLQTAENVSGPNEESSSGESSNNEGSNIPEESSSVEESSNIEESGSSESSNPGENSNPEESSTIDESSKVDDGSEESSGTIGDSELPGENDESSDSSGSAGDKEESSESGQPSEPQKPEDSQNPEEEQQPQIGITKYDLQQVRLVVQEAQLAYDQLKENYAQEVSQRQSEMQSLLDKVGEDTIYAAFSGRVVKINVNVGDYVRQYDTVMLLVNEEVTLLRGKKYSNAYLARVANMDVVIDGKTYEIEYIPYDEEEYLKRSLNKETLPSWFEMEETEEVSFGESGTVRVYIDYSLDTLVIPSSCVQKDDLGDYVYKFEDGQRVKTYVTIGIRTATYAEILDGLNEGDDVYGTE